MTWLSWVLVFVVVDYLLRFVVWGLPAVDDSPEPVRGGNGLFVEPGILAEPRNQVSPIAGVLGKYASLFYCRLGRIVFSPRHTTRVHARRIVEIARTHELQRVTLAGISLGAAVSLDVGREMRKIDPDMPKPDLIVFDGIGSGSKNLLSGFNVIAPICWALRFFPIGLISGLVISTLIAVPQALWINQGPKDDEIEDDIVVDGYPVTKEEVKAKAQKDMSWYLLTALARQLIYMHSNKLTPDRLQCFGKIVYFEYTWHNVTLQQPAERLKWQKAARAAGVPFEFWEIETPHVAFAQMPRTNSKVLEQVLPRFLG